MFFCFRLFFLSQRPGQTCHCRKETIWQESDKKEIARNKFFCVAKSIPKQTSRLTSLRLKFFFGPNHKLLATKAEFKSLTLKI